MKYQLSYNAPATFVDSALGKGLSKVKTAIVQPMFTPVDAGYAPEFEGHTEVAETDLVPVAAVLQDDVVLIDPEVIEPIEVFADRMGLEPEALAQHPIFTGFVPGSLGQAPGSEPDFKPGRHDAGSTKLDKMGWASQDGAVKRDLGQVTQNPDGGKTVTDTSIYEDGSRTHSSTTYDRDGRVTSTSNENIDSEGNYSLITINRDENGNPQAPEQENGHYENGQRIPDDLGGPDSQPGDENTPGTVGGVFNPEVETDPKLNPQVSVDGKSVAERFAETDLSQSTDLTWQEQLALDDLKVTNPGAEMVEVDNFAFTTPEVNPDGSTGPDPEPIGPVLKFDASAAAPELGSHIAASVGGDFPTDTIDPDDGLIGGPSAVDEFLF